MSVPQAYLRTISLPDEIPSAHFCIGGHNPFRVFCNVGIIPTPLPPPLCSFLQSGQNPFCELGQNSSPLKSPTSLQADQSLTWSLGYYFNILAFDQTFGCGGSNFSH